MSGAAAGAAMRCQVAVVGSGPGGAITAALLAEAGADVLVLEEGPDLTLDDCRPYSRAELELKYRDGGLTSARGNPPVQYVEACCAGGGSEVNSGLYHRTPPEVLLAWASRFGLTDATESDLAPHFAACEEALSVGLAPGPVPAAAVRLRDGAGALGWRVKEAPRWMRHAPGDAPGRGRRQSMTETFLPRARAAGATVLPGTRAHRVRRAGDGWEVDARARDAAGREAPLAVRADRVVLAAGAVQTPAILLRSGIRHAVGRLQVHPTVKLIARFRDEVNGPEAGVPAHQVREFAPRLSFGCSVSTPAQLAVALLDHPGHVARLTETWRHWAVYYAMVAPEGGGRVHVAPGVGAPFVTYRVARSDLAELARGLGLLARALFRAGAVELVPSVRGLGPFTREEDLAAIPRVLPKKLTSLMTVHVFSTVPFGENRSVTAADSFGRVHGAPGLHVHDASLLPEAPGVNPQGSVMAFAHRAASRLADGGLKR